MERLIVAELNNIFKLITACFDKKTLFNLLGITEPWGITHFNKIIKDDYSDIKDKLGFPIKEDIIQFNPRSYAKPIIKQKLHGIDDNKLEEISNYIMYYIFTPKYIDSTVKPLLDYFKESKENLDFKSLFKKRVFWGIDAFFRENKDPISYEKYFKPKYLKENINRKIKKIKENLESEKDIDKKNKLKEKLEEFENKLKSVSEKNKEEEKTVETKDIPYGLTDDMIENLQDARSLFEDVSYEKLIEGLLSYTKKLDKPDVYKVIKLKSESPDLTDEETAKLLKKEDASFEKLLYVDVKDAVVDFAKKIKDDGDEDLYKKLVKLDWTQLKKEKSKEKKIKEDEKKLKHKYYVAVDKKHYGPFEKLQIKKLLDNKKITTKTPVWREGMTDWLKIENLSDFKTANEENKKIEASNILNYLGVLCKKFNIE